MAALASARAFASFALAVMSFSTVSFFWMGALARLSSDLAIMAACLASVAALLAKALSFAIIRLMSRVSANATVQCSFQLFHM